MTDMNKYDGLVFRHRDNRTYTAHVLHRKDGKYMVFGMTREAAVSDQDPVDFLFVENQFKGGYWEPLFNIKDIATEVFDDL